MTTVTSDFQQAPGVPPPTPGPTAAEYERFVRAIRSLTGLDLSSYKPQQFMRRLPSLLARARVSSLAEYRDLLVQDPQRLREFMDWVGIHVSEFFRDPAVYQFVETQVLPQLIRRSGVLRIWSAGCSIGAEPYSLAMLLEDLGGGRPYRLLASDVSPEVLRLAQQGGPYREDHVRSLSPERRRRWLTERPEGLWLRRELIAKVQFFRHDLLQDPYPKELGLITCRNVAIYFLPTVRDDVYRRLAQSLAPGGFLLLGGSEAIHRPQDLGLVRVGPSCYQRTA